MPEHLTHGDDPRALAECIAAHDFCFLPGDRTQQGLAALRADWNGDLALDPGNHTVLIRTRDGHWRWYQERGRIVDWHDDGRPRRMVGTQSDISEQRQREQAASLIAARLERLAQHVPGILYQFELDADLTPRFPYMSERARTLLGLDPALAALDAAVLMDRIVPEDRERVTASIIESAHALTLWAWEFRVRVAPDELRWIRATSSPLRLPDVDTVFAMTVHKSQGSEFTHTALILPDALNPVLTKELIYTGITRAKRWFSLVEPRGGVFEEAVRRKVKRLSGLMLELDLPSEKNDW